MPKKQKTTAATPEVAGSIAESIFDRSLRYLDAQITAVIEGKAAKTKHDPAYRVATLAQKAAQVESERRKLRAAENKKLERITRPLVIAWFRTLDKEERRSIARELAAMDQEGSILA